MGVFESSSFSHALPDINSIKNAIRQEIVNVTQDTAMPSLSWSSVSQTVVSGPQVVLRFCPCGPLRLNISPKKTEKIKLT
jgi:hypothetical protein